MAAILIHYSRTILLHYVTCQDFVWNEFLKLLNDLQVTGLKRCHRQESAPLVTCQQNPCQFYLTLLELLQMIILT